MIKIIPLFPLAMAVLPGQRIPLHIFEDRYKNLINDCMADESNSDGKITTPSEFGVNYSSEDGLAAIGCSLSIVKVLKRFKDGRFDLIAEGQRRFRLCELIEGKSYQQGKIDFITESDGFTHSSPANKKFHELHQEMCVVAGVKSTIPFGLAHVSFQSACAMGLDDYQRQTLLELASESDRIAWLTDIYQAILNQVKTGKNSFLNGALADIKSGRDPGLQQIH